MLIWALLSIKLTFSQNKDKLFLFSSNNWLSPHWRINKDYFFFSNFVFIRWTNSSDIWLPVLQCQKDELQALVFSSFTTSYLSQQIIYEYAEQHRCNTYPYSSLVPNFPSLCLSSHSKFPVDLSSTISFAEATLTFSHGKLSDHLVTLFFFLIIDFLSIELCDILLNHH